MTSSEKKTSALGFGPAGSNRMDFSGKERDKLFLSSRGEKFVDVSYLGGVDNPQDGRTVAMADLDHDGSLEMLVAYRNAPMLRIYRPSIPRGRVLGLRLSGGGLGSNLDAVGAKITATCGGEKTVRILQVGAGFATQNAHTQTLGVGSCETIDELTVKWPNGRERVFKNKKTDEMYSLSEDGPLRHEPGFFKAPFAPSERAPFARSEGAQRPSRSVSAPALLDTLATGRAFDSKGGSRAWAPSRDVVFVTFWASWCESCKKAQPRLDALASRYGGRVDFVGVTLDAKDDAAVVGKYAVEHKAAYPLLALESDARARFLEQAKPWFRGAPPPLPSALVIERATGKVLLRSIGAPTVSELEAALGK